MEEDNYPLLFHCTGGKDRTGLASALLLSALDVSDTPIMDEYLLSNYYLFNSSEDSLIKAALFLGIDHVKKALGIGEEGKPSIELNEWRNVIPY